MPDESQPPAVNRPDSIEAYTCIFLACGGRCLLLQRAAEKSFAPLRWTGLGGHVEQDEFFTLRASALRELQEESGIGEDSLRSFTLRRALLTNRPGAGLRLILYYTGELEQPVLPACPEGELSWVTPEQFDGLDIIENTRPVLACLVDDMKRDPDGVEAVVTGLGVFQPDGSFRGVTWG